VGRDATVLVFVFVEMEYRQHALVKNSHHPNAMRAQSVENVFRSLARKRDKGTYDSKKAPKAFRALLEAAAKHYLRENGARGEKWFVTFPVIVRREAARELVETFDGWYGVDYQAEKNRGAPTAQ
jgi:hypothetical protein